MAKILIFNTTTKKTETYFRDEHDPMPYTQNHTLLVRDFRGALYPSASPTLWTDSATMRSWHDQCTRWREPIPVGAAFKRPWEGGHTAQSQHYAGAALDVGQYTLGWDSPKRARLRADAAASGLWRYVEPASISPTWVHLDRRPQPPACRAGFPALRTGGANLCVLVLRDCLNTLGYKTGGLTCDFDDSVERAVTAFQRNAHLVPDGIVGCNTWTALTARVVGKGRRPDTID